MGSPSTPEYFIYDEVNSHFFYDGSWFDYRRYFDSQRRQTYSIPNLYNYFDDCAGIIIVEEFNEYIHYHRSMKTIPADKLLIISKTGRDVPKMTRNKSSITGQFNFNIEHEYPVGELRQAFRYHIQTSFGKFLQKRFENISSISTFVNSNNEAKDKPFKYISTIKWPQTDIQRICETIQHEEAKLLYSNDYRYNRQITYWLSEQLPGCNICSGTNHIAYKQYRILHNNPDDLLVLKMSTDMVVEHQINLYDEYEQFYQANARSFASDFLTKVSIEGLYSNEKLRIIL